MGRKCLMCEHPKRDDIERVAHLGSHREAAGKYGVNRVGLTRHMRYHFERLLTPPPTEAKVETSPPLGEPPVVVGGSSLERAQALLQFHYDERQRLRSVDAAEAARAQNANAILATEKLIADLTGAFEVTPAQIVKSPHFSRVLDLMFALLKDKWPDALLACRKLLRQEAGLDE